MSRQKFNGWGDELSDEDFACALAELGRVTHKLLPIERRGPPDESLRKITPWSLLWSDSRIETLDISAQKAADDWRSFSTRAQRARLAHAPIGVRLECETAFNWLWTEWPLEISKSNKLDRAWNTSMLSRAHLVGSVSWITDDSAIQTAWGWPLDVGFFSDRLSLELMRRTDSEADHRFRALRRHVRIDAAESPVELMVLPGSLEASLSQPPIPGDALVHTVLVLGGADSSDGEDLLLEAVRRRARADAAVLLRVPREGQAAWLDSLTVELSHNTPFDVALFKCCARHRLPSPFVLGKRGAFLGAQLSEVSRRVAHRTFALAFDPNDPANRIDQDRGNRISSALRLPDFARVGGELRGLFKKIDEHIDSFRWDHESDEATSLIEFFDAAREVESTRAALPRYLQANLFRVSTPEERVDGPLMVGQRHRAEVYIGPPEVGAILANTPLPEGELPDTPEGVLLDIHWIELTWGDRLHPTVPQFARVRLPRKGTSENASFFFTPSEGLHEYVARVLILFRGRVLQTALVRASVGESPAEGVVARVDVESVTRTFEAIEQPGRGFDVAMVFNDTVSRLATMIRGGQATVLPLGADISALVTNIGQVLDRYANAQDADGPLDSEDTRTLLVSLASKGRLLRDQLTDCDPNGDFSSATRIQLVSMKSDAVLPLELCYEGPAPDATARLCPGAAVGLRDQPTGCGPLCAGPSAAVICPNAFWALSKRIERHSFDLAASMALQGVDYAALREEEISRRAALSMSNGILWAVNERAEVNAAGTIDECERALEDRFTAAGTHRARTWDEWRDAVTAHRPSLLAIVAHTDKSRNADISLVIEKDAGIDLAQIDEAHVRAAPDGHPIVLLLGCSTADESLSPFNVISRFRQKKAAIIVGTLGKVIGRHAARTAVALARAVYDAANRPSEPRPTFGDVLLSTRRKLFASGKTMMLGVAAFGDADWKL